MVNAVGQSEPFLKDKTFSQVLRILSYVFLFIESIRQSLFSGLTGNSVQAGRVGNGSARGPTAVRGCKARSSELGPSSAEGSEAGTWRGPVPNRLPKRGPLVDLTRRELTIAEQYLVMSAQDKVR